MKTLENIANFEIGNRVHLRDTEIMGTVKDTVSNLCMVELDNGNIEAYYNRQLEVV
jgi:hypothetical protein